MLSSSLPFFVLAPLSAQEEPPPVIMPTARVEAIPGVPSTTLPLQATGAQELALYDIDALQDISGIAPNLFISGSDSRGFGDILSLRGVSNTIFFSPPGVGLYVDGVPGGSVTSYPGLLLATESVTVLPGPHGSLYGRNTPGGVIDIRTRTHGDTHSGAFEAEYGTYDAYGFTAAVDGPVIPGELGYSAGFSVNGHEGYIHNTTFDTDADERFSVAGQGGLFWTPTDNTRIRLKLLVEHADDGGQRLSPLDSPDPFVSNANLIGETVLDRAQLSLSMEHDFDWGTVKSITSRQQLSVDPATTDVDPGFFPGDSTSTIIQDQYVWTQEFQVISPEDAGPLSWRGGFFFFDENDQSDSTRVIDIEGVPVDPVNLPGAVFNPDSFQTEQTIYEIEETNIAGYVHAIYEVTEELSVELGGRLDYNESSIDRSKQADTNGSFEFFGTNPVVSSATDPRLDESQSHVYFSPTGIVRYEIMPGLSAHAKGALAHKPEGYSGFTADPAAARFDAEQSWNTEIGLTFIDEERRLQASVTAFWNLIDNYQYERTIPNSTDFVVVNADDVTTRGFEAAVKWLPIEALLLDLQFGYNDARFDEHRDSAGNSVEDNRVPFIPEFTARAGAEYAFLDGFFVGTAINAFGNTHYDEQNSTEFRQGAFATWDARAGYRYEGFSATIYARNILDEEYYQFINDQIRAGSPGAPQTVGFIVGYEY